MRTAIAILVVSIAAAVGLARWQTPSEASPTIESARFDASAAAWSDRSSSSNVEDPDASASPGTIPVRSAQAAVAAENGTAPVRISVPSVGLDAAIVPVGVDDRGLFDVPSADQVGWYQYGPAPGEAGSAVLAGHVDYNGDVGVFFDLKQMVDGELVHLDYEDGSSQSFKVVDQTLYEKSTLPADKLFRRGGASVLHLATCGGRFDPSSGSYLGNRVVTAVPVDVVLDPGPVS